MGFAAQVHKPN